MTSIPAGVAWIGSPTGKGAKDEHPRYQARISPFCLDTTEVTVEAYAGCVEAKTCQPVAARRVTCTASGTKRKHHPVNCVSWHDARTFCDWRGARLPTEAEWEYAASGGDDRTYSWGDEPPDGRTCWKKPGACAVASFAPGAFGLHDMTGNVWEWTNDGYGDYPFPSMNSPVKVYRGGSWSRRFEKWMRVRLRNRWAAHRSGSHLGFRCALTPPDAPCSSARTEEKACRSEVLAVQCEGKLQWNGVRCARPGAPRCPANHESVPGYGCVRPSGDERSPKGKALVDVDVVARKRSPAFDADCKEHQAPRPHAYRLEGGTHAARNQVARSAGCKNRDVGVGWNSVCCP